MWTNPTFSLSDIEFIEAQKSCEPRVQIHPINEFPTNEWSLTSDEEGGAGECSSSTQEPDAIWALLAKLVENLVREEAKKAIQWRVEASLTTAPNRGREQRRGEKAQRKGRKQAVGRTVEAIMNTETCQLGIELESTWEFEAAKVLKLHTPWNPQERVDVPTLGPFCKAIFDEVMVVHRAELIAQGHNLIHESVDELNGDVEVWEDEWMYEEFEDEELEENIPPVPENLDIEGRDENWEESISPPRIVLGERQA